MKTTRRMIVKVARLLWSATQWLMVGVFILLAIDAATESNHPVAAIAMTICVALTIPPLRHKLTTLSRGKLNRKTSLVAVVALFFIAVATIPPRESKHEPLQAVSNIAPVVENKPIIPPKKTPRIEKIERYADGRYGVVGYGPVESEIAVMLGNGLRYAAGTNRDGFFVVVLPPNATPFGTIMLQNNILDDKGQYENLHERYHYTFFASRPVVSESALAPVITKVMKDGGKMKIEGFSEPKSPVVMMYKNQEIAKAPVNGDGYYVFTSLTKAEHFMEVVVLNDAARQLLDTSFIDTTIFTLNETLPRWTKKISAIEPITFTTREDADPNLVSGETRVTQEGVDGKKTVYYLVTYVGAQEIGRTVTHESVDVKPVEKIVVRGTYVAPPLSYSFSAPSPAPSTSTYYANCTAARAAGVTPIYRGQPGYGTHLDRDGDGVACER